MDNEKKYDAAVILKTMAIITIGVTCGLIILTDWETLQNLGETLLFTTLWTYIFAIGVGITQYLVAKIFEELI